MVAGTRITAEEILSPSGRGRARRGHPKGPPPAHPVAVVPVDHLPRWVARQGGFPGPPQLLRVSRKFCRVPRLVVLNNTPVPRELALPVTFPEGKLIEVLSHKEFNSPCGLR